MPPGHHTGRAHLEAGKQLSVCDIAPAHRAALRELYRDDYCLLGELFDDVASRCAS